MLEANVTNCAGSRKMPIVSCGRLSVSHFLLCFIYCCARRRAEHAGENGLLGHYNKAPVYVRYVPIGVIEGQIFPNRATDPPFPSRSRNLS